MKKILLAFLLLVSAPALRAQLTYDQLVVQYDSAIDFQQLEIIPIVRKGPGTGIPGLISLGEAIRQGKAVITERGSASTENVHWLRINNNSNQPIYISSGEVVAGGRQDRMIAQDTIMVPNGHDQYFSVMCVEEGRWSKKRVKEFKYFSYANPQLRKTLAQTHNQVVIWREVLRQLDSSRVENDAYAYTAARSDRQWQPHVEEYYRYFMERLQRPDSSVVGFIAVSGDRVIGADIFETNRLFNQELPALLPGYIEDALVFGGPPALTNASIREYADQLLMSEAGQEKFCREHGNIFRYGGRPIHVTGFAVE